MIYYTDQFGRFHDKPTDGVNHSSGNGWIYTAIACKIRFPGWNKVNPVAGITCTRYLRRHPHITTYGQEQSPISRDEVLGLAYLGFLKETDLDGWSFSPFNIPSFNPFKLISQAIKLVDWDKKELKHRTTFWKQGYDQIYRFAFSVPIADRHFLNQCWGKYNPLWHLVHILLHRKQPEHRTSRLLRYLKTGKDWEAVPNYFGDKHPFTSWLERER